jgi:hypothetical protein
LAYRLSTRKTIKLDQKYEIPALYLLLEFKGKLRKFWKETNDPTCKTAVN